MKISVFGTRGFPDIQGGVEKHCESLYRSLEKRHKFTVFRRKPYVKKVLNDVDIEFVDLPSTQIKGVEALVHSFICSLICIYRRPDIVHIHNIGPGLFIPLLRITGLKVVLTYHSPNYEHSKWGYLSKLLLRFSEFIALSCSNRIIFVNRFQLDKQNEKIKRKSIYIANGINKMNKISSSNFLSELGVKPFKYILAVGRITPEKGFVDLINAYNNAKQNDCKLVIAGGVEHEGAYFQQLKKISDERVIFTGAINSELLAELYSSAKLFVLSSHNEGFPLVVLEAMQFDCNILLSDIPATRLLDLTDDYYYPKGDIKKLTDKLNISIACDVKCHNYDLKDYDWTNIAQQTNQVYESLY